MKIVEDIQRYANLQKFDKVDIPDGRVGRDGREDI